jgi:uncharacterized protein (TIGR03643 family)
MLHGGALHLEIAEKINTPDALLYQGINLANKKPRHGLYYVMDTIDIDRIIEMAWEDRTPFEAIAFQFGLSEAQVIRLMRKELKRSSFNLWRKRVNDGTSQKHAHKRKPGIQRFKCALQRTITHNKISKR